MRTVDERERRARLGRRHGLAPGTAAADPVSAARAVVAVHGTDASTVYLSLRARLRKAEPPDVDRALHDDRALVRVLAMRRTVFVIPTHDLPVVHAAATTGLIAGERRRAEQLVATLGKSSRWLRSVEAKTAAAIEARGEALAAELGEDVPELRLQVTVGEGKKWAGTQSLSTRVLWLLANEGRIVRDRPRDSWTSSQHRWAPMERWLPDGLPAVDPAAARATLVRRWLAAYGPGTAADIAWWTGWGTKLVHAALATAGAVQVALAGDSTGWLLPDDLEPVAKPKPWVALLPALDATAMGWKDRSWFLDPDLSPRLFDRSGNIGPTIWCDGRIVGGWAQRKSGEVVTHLLTDVGSARARAVTAEAARVETFIGPARVTPRFRTPLERELAS